MQRDRMVEDGLIEVYSSAVDAAMHRANERDGYGSSGSRESIVAGLRAVAEKAWDEGHDLATASRFEDNIEALYHYDKRNNPFAATDRWAD